MTRRLIWIVNHRTLLTAEVPILRDLGFEVLVPKIIPDDPGLRSLVASDVYDAGLGLSSEVLATLNAHNFYEDPWSSALSDLINEHFEVVVSLVSSYLTPIAETAAKFDGRLVARVFGREDPRTYTELMAGWATPLLPRWPPWVTGSCSARGSTTLPRSKRPSCATVPTPSPSRCLTRSTRTRLPGGETTSGS